MSDDLEDYIAILEEIDTKIHHLLEDLEGGNDLDVSLQVNAIQTLRNARSQIDPVLLAFRQQQDSRSTADSDAITLQWTPTGAPPRRLIIEPATGDEEWSHRTLEWDGSGWRPRNRSDIEDVAVRAPTESDHLSPTDPPRLETLQAKLHEKSSHPDPLALVFEATTTTEQAVVVAVDGELRYRQYDDSQWCQITEDELTRQLKQQGQPTLQPLSETQFNREHFMDSLHNGSESTTGP